jgi:hypothetical protein
MEERRLALVFYALPLWIGELSESEQTQGEKIAGARIAVTGEKQDGSGLGTHDELELRVAAFAEAVDDLGSCGHLHRRAIGYMDLERHSRRVGNDRPVDLTGREAQRPSRRLTDASSSINSPSGDSTIWWARTPRSLNSDVTVRSQSVEPVFL